MQVKQPAAGALPYIHIEVLIAVSTYVFTWIALLRNCIKCSQVVAVERDACTGVEYLECHRHLTTKYAESIEHRAIEYNVSFAGQ